MNKIHSAYWFRDIGQVEDLSLFDYASIQNSISNFVKIITERDDIKVGFSTSREEGGKSTKDTIIISSQINKENIDSIVGLTLHEASHILLTDFNFKTENNNNNFHSIFNWIEDRRIDHYILSNIAGYRGYYAKLYDKYFNNLKVKTQIEHSKNRDSKSIHCWIFHLINMISKHRDVNALKELDKLYELIDLKNINRLKSTQDAYELALEVWDFINERVEGDIYEHIPVLKDQDDFVNGDVKKKPISPKEKSMIEQISKLNIKDLERSNLIDNVKPKDQKIKDSFLHNFLHSTQLSTNKVPVKEGINMGKKLASKLQFRNLDQKITYHNQNKGRVDARNLYKATFDDLIFKQDFIKEHKKTHIHLSIDGSGSMCMYDKDFKTLKLSACMATIACLIPNIRVSISVRKVKTDTKKKDINITRKPVTIIIFDSLTDSIKDISKLSHIDFKDLTPEGLCFGSIKKYIEMNPISQEKIVFVNISDGFPSAMLDTIKEKVEEVTRKKINEFKREGIDVLSYFVESGSTIKATKGLKTFKRMYGNTSEILNVNNFSKILKDINKQLK
tara:strand:- start:849 stop:2531 length:1683 start_codon:yes stop_codon:yes gene_type:complete